MGQSNCLERAGAVDVPVDPDWFAVSADKAYECRVLLVPEADGGYTAIALRLPGVASQGDTVDEALANIRDAFQAALQTYVESGVQIPWENREVERPSGSVERWILVDV